MDAKVDSPGMLAQLKALNQRLTLNQKLSIVGLATVILCSLLGFVYLIDREPYPSLYNNLDPQEASAIVAKLDELGIDYQLSQGGRAIAVPRDDIDQARMALATEGLPQQGRLGFEIFDQGNWGMTDFAEKVNFIRAKEGELERTINSLQEVRRARVHLVLSKESLFREDEEPAKSSVVLELVRSNALSASQVKGITNLVAFAVEGLTPDRVTVVDVHGNLLSRPEEEGQVSQTLTELRRRLERELAGKVSAILSPLLGSEKVRVSASVLLDTRQTSQTEELFDPNQSVLRKQRKVDQRATAATAGGVPFKANNADGAEQLTEGQSLVTEETHYDISKTVRNTVLPSGNVRQLSVAVVVDNKTVVETNADGQTSESSVAREPEEIQRLYNLVSASIGLDETRGDRLTVENYAFSPLPPMGPPPGWLDSYWNPLVTAFGYLRIVLLFVLFYLLVFRPVRNRVFSYIDVQDSTFGQLTAGGVGPDGKPIAQLGEGTAAQLAAADGKRLQEGEPPEELVPDMATMKEQLLSFCQEQPDTVTRLVRIWLDEEARA